MLPIDEWAVSLCSLTCSMVWCIWSGGQSFGSGQSIANQSPAVCWHAEFLHMHAKCYQSVRAECVKRMTESAPPGKPSASHSLEPTVRPGLRCHVHCIVAVHPHVLAPRLHARKGTVFRGQWKAKRKAVP